MLTAVRNVSFAGGADTTTDDVAAPCSSKPIRCRKYVLSVLGKCVETVRLSLVRSPI